MSRYVTSASGAASLDGSTKYGQAGRTRTPELAASRMRYSRARSAGLIETPRSSALEASLTYRAGGVDRLTAISPNRPDHGTMNVGHQRHDGSYESIGSGRIRLVDRAVGRFRLLVEVRRRSGHRRCNPTRSSGAMAAAPGLGSHTSTRPVQVDHRTPRPSRFGHRSVPRRLLRAQAGRHELLAPGGIRLDGMDSGSCRLAGGTAAGRELSIAKELGAGRTIRSALHRRRHRHFISAVGDRRNP